LALDELSMGSSETCVYGAYAMPCWFLGACSSWSGITYFLMMLRCLAMSRRCSWTGERRCSWTGDVDVLKVVWQTIGFCNCSMVIVESFRIIMAVSLGLYGLVIWFAIRMSLYGIMGVVCLRRRFVHRVQSWLMSRGEAATAAASIAVLLGGLDSENVLATARSSFLCVSADKLTFEDMADNKPNPALFALTEHSRLGTVDAFLSHSWHDDAESKWAALQEWREEFKEAHNGTEPKLWIDKFCIDQNSIDKSLACLPVYLAGCKTLLVLCGPTYLKRLWCLVEIFIFLEMGGTNSNLTVRLLLGETTTLAMAVKNFDVKRARCFTDHDTERLQEVIEATGYQKITQLIIAIFLGRGFDVPHMGPSTSRFSWLMWSPSSSAPGHADSC